MANALAQKLVHRLLDECYNHKRMRGGGRGAGASIADQKHVSFGQFP